MKSICVIFGTRPEAIKLAPVVKYLKKQSDIFRTTVVTTAQHRTMLDQVLDVFKIVPDIDLGLMTVNQSLNELTALTLKSVGRVLNEISPDFLVVQGDTTTVFSAALAAFYVGVPVGHVEAGLRSHNLTAPFPEEGNRHLTSVLSTLHFAPTEQAKDNLLAEGYSGNNIAVTGNTVVDALLDIPHLEESALTSLIPKLCPGKKFILVTSHRRETQGQELENICRALKDIKNSFDDFDIVFPVHLNPNVRNTVFSLLSDHPGIHLIEPLDYPSFVNVMRKAYVILTDSGGIQEEAPTFGIPVLVLRQVTERPEASLLGQSRIIGTNSERIIIETKRLLTDKVAYQHMASGGNPYGDGRAAERIVTGIHRWFSGVSPMLDATEIFDPGNQRYISG